MAYQKQEWENLPAQTTPLSAARLEHLETQYDEAMAETSGLLVNKADLVGGKVPIAQVPTATTTTANTLPVRGTSGVIQGVGTPSATTDAANKAYVDSKLFSSGQTPVENTVPVRGTNGTLPGIGNPINNTDAANKQYVDALATDMSNFEDQVAMVQDLILPCVVSTSPTGTMSIGGAAEHTLFIAPTDMEITGVVVSFDNAIDIAGTTNSFNMRIIHRPTGSATAVNIVQKNTNMEPIQRRVPWSLTNGNWGSVADRTVPAGDYVAMVFGSFTGTVSISYPIIVTVEWRPVR